MFGATGDSAQYTEGDQQISLVSGQMFGFLLGFGTHWQKGPLSTDLTVDYIDKSFSAKRWLHNRNRLERGDALITGKGLAFSGNLKVKFSRRFLYSLGLRYYLKNIDIKNETQRFGINAALGFCW
ncbi:MAG: hypothetical protein KDI06_04975 [Calditrichaeota bacterium]|nr:hypothetical protein [Calditrichota bacterium]